MYIDHNGDRLADYSLLDMTDPHNGTFEVSIRNIHNINEVFYQI